MITELNFFEISLVDDINFVSSISAYRIIDKGVGFSIKATQLQESQEYIANLCTEDLEVIIPSTSSSANGSGFTFIWSAESTEKLPTGKPLMLEIYNSNREVMYRKEKFALARNTSAITKD